MLVVFAIFNFILFLSESDAHLPVSGSQNYPTLQPGETCVAGEKYQIDCNTCKCSHTNELLCTKMACHSMDQQLKEYLESMKQNQNNKTRKIHAKKQKKTNLPSLPEGECVPGMMYEKDCRRCFCNDQKTVLCSEKDLCMLRNKVRNEISKVEDIRSPISEEELNTLPFLHQQSEQCEPGKSYRVDCSLCVCDKDENLVCDQMVCLSLHDMIADEAKAKTGTPCSTTEVTETSCIRCKCEDGSKKCSVMPNCTYQLVKTRRALGDELLRTSTIDPTAKHIECIPNKVYKDNCNKCYCQSDKSLICTKKRCLNYTEYKEMHEQMLSLKENDL